MKICNTCKQEKPLDEFYADHKRPDGKQYPCKDCQAKMGKYYRQRNRQMGRIPYETKNHRKKKKEVLLHYSSGFLVCACCKESYYEFLCIDHIDGGGSKHRKELRENGHQSIYRWLINNGFPKGFRVLCYNCNQSLGLFGYCPHNNL